MMIASNNGVGMSMGFPDPKMTPPLGAPIPYPNMAMNCMAVVFSPNIFVGYMPQLTMASIKPITLGNQAGAMHPLFMMMGGQTAGNPRMLINCIPAKHLCVPTWGNLFNNPIGLVSVPSVTTTFYSDNEAKDVTPLAAPLSAEAMKALERAAEGSADVVDVEQVAEGVAHLAIRRFSRDVCTRVFNALRKVDVTSACIIDLRGNPGGDCRAALELADEFVERGELLAVIDETREIRARYAPSYTMPSFVLIDGQTASAAEVLAACLQHHGATVIGKQSFGKGTAQRAMKTAEGGYTYATAATYAGPGGPIEGVGVTPDWDSEDALALALQLASKDCGERA